jgi:hypothetical protein
VTASRADADDGNDRAPTIKAAALDSNQRDLKELPSLQELRQPQQYGDSPPIAREEGANRQMRRLLAFFLH